MNFRLSASAINLNYTNYNMKHLIVVGKTRGLEFRPDRRILTRQRAIRALETWQFRPHEDRPFWAAVEGQLPRFFLSELKRKFNYSEELPESSLGYSHPDYPKMKCIGAVICGISGNLTSIVVEGQVRGEGFVELANRFAHYGWNFRKTGAFEVRRTTRDEIGFINYALKEAISCLRAENGLE
jgi:hypothetical protein